MRVGVAICKVLKKDVLFSLIDRWVWGAASPKKQSKYLEMGSTWAI